MDNALKTGAYEVLRHVLVAELGPGVLTLPDVIFPCVFRFCQAAWLGLHDSERRHLCRELIWAPFVLI